MPNQNYSRSALVKWLVNHLQQTTEINQDEILHVLAMQPSDLENVLGRLSMPKYLALLNWAALRTGSADFGINLASQIPNGLPGSVGCVMSHIATLREHFQFLHRFGVDFQDAVRFTFVEGPISGRLEYKLVPTGGVNSRHDSEYTLASLVGLFRRYVGNQFVPIQVSFTHAEPTQVAEHQRVFGSEVHFEQPVNAIYFASSLLQTGVSNVNPSLLVSLQTHLGQILHEYKREGTLISRVRFFIAAKLCSRTCVVENAAVYLLFSQRSLTRHLQRQGTSFRKLKQGVLAEVAKCALAESDASVVEISKHLGFSETSAFDRSFRKLTGYTPLQYRDLQRC
jgi:AraC-like DNA-binding protein